MPLPGSLRGSTPLLSRNASSVTVDALNTQKEIANEIREQGADYVMAIKENHPTLCNEVEGIFEAVREDDNADGSIRITESVETNHGRTETRRCWSVEAPNWITGFEEWRDPQSLILVQATREFKEQQTTESSTDKPVRNYLFSSALPLLFMRRIKSSTILRAIRPFPFSPRCTTSI